MIATIKKGFLLFIVGLILGFGIRCYENLKEFSGVTGFYSQRYTFTREEIQSYWNMAAPDTKQEIRDITLFSPQESVEIMNPVLNRGVQAGFIQVAGNMNLVVPQSLMHGAFTESQDIHGCVVSKKTAESLFSSHEILGEKVYLNGKIYLIRGILDIREELCLIQGSENCEYTYMKVDAPGIPLSVVKQQLTALLPYDVDSVSEGQLYTGIGGMLFWIPAWIPLVYLLMILWKKAKEAGDKDREYKWQRILAYLLRYGVVLSGFLGASVILLLSLHFSDDYIPSAWSDFSFWSNLLIEKWKDFRTLAVGKLLYSERKMFANLLGIILASSIESITLIAGCKSCFFVRDLD